MVPTRPSRNRIRLQREIGGLTITIAARRNWALILFLGFWLCGWLIGEFFALTTLLGGRAGIGGSLFLLVWLSLWTVGGVAAWYMWLWSLTGEETIVVGPDAISVRRTVFGVGRTRLLARRALRNLRATGIDAAWAHGAGGGRIERGRLAVEIDGTTRRFGLDLTAEEAEYLIGAIRSEIDIPDAMAAPAFEPAAIPA